MSVELSYGVMGIAGGGVTALNVMLRNTSKSVLHLLGDNIIIIFALLPKFMITIKI